MIDLLAFSVANPGLVVWSVAAGAAARQPYGTVSTKVAGIIAAGLIVYYGTGAVFPAGMLP